MKYKAESGTPIFEGVGFKLNNQLIITYWEL